MVNKPNKKVNKIETYKNIYGSKNQIIAIMKVKTFKPAMKVTKTVKNPTKKVKKTNVIIVSDIRSKWEINKELSHNYNADIDVKNNTIRIYGHTQECVNWRTSEYVNKPFDKTFKKGDVVEVDSYNYVYTGEILSVGSKTVTVVEHSRNKRMNLAEFIRRNHKLDLEKIAERNLETSYCI
jgi:hypothetical protein